MQVRWEVLVDLVVKLVRELGGLVLETSETQLANLKLVGENRAANLIPVLGLGEQEVESLWINQAN
jgi:hypothetical protein